MADKINIETNLNWKEGEVFSAGREGIQPINVTNLKGTQTHPDTWSPLHLFVSSIETCFFATLQNILDRARVTIKSYKSHAVGELTPTDEKHKEITKVILHIDAGLENPGDQEKVRRLMDKSEDYCYVARSAKCLVVIEATFR